MDTNVFDSDFYYTHKEAYKNLIHAINLLYDIEYTIRRHIDIQALEEVFDHIALDMEYYIQDVYIAYENGSEDKATNDFFSLMNDMDDDDEKIKFLDLLDVYGEILTKDDVDNNNKVIKSYTEIEGFDHFRFVFK